MAPSLATAQVVTSEETCKIVRMKHEEFKTVRARMRTAPCARMPDRPLPHILLYPSLAGFAGSAG